MPRSTPAADPPSASTAFKDQIDAALVARLSAALVRADPSFGATGFRRVATRGLADLELKARIRHVAEALDRYLPRPFPEGAVRVRRRLALPVAHEGDPPGGLSGWDLWPVPEWVMLAGRDEPEVALELLATCTRWASGEFAIRPFIDDDPAAVMARLRTWAARDDEHVRRLCTEGTRPLLPWAPRLAAARTDPGFAVELLDRLVDDPSEFVRRSVSNHLNDLCKLDPGLAVDLAGSWTQRHAAGTTGSARVDWVVRRGLRTLVKAGDPDTLRLLGHDPDLALRARLTLGTPVVHLGGAATWELRLRSEASRSASVVVDYAIGFLRADGTPGRKVFKWTTRELAPGQELVLERRHRITPISIRTYRTGTHPLEVQVNGRVVASTTFELVAD